MAIQLGYKNRTTAFLVANYNYKMLIKQHFRDSFIEVLNELITVTTYICAKLFTPVHLVRRTQQLLHFLVHYLILLSNACQHWVNNN